MTDGRAAPAESAALAALAALEALMAVPCICDQSSSSATSSPDRAVAIASAVDVVLVGPKLELVR